MGEAFGMSNSFIFAFNSYFLSHTSVGKVLLELEGKALAYTFSVINSWLHE